MKFNKPTTIFYLLLIAFTVAIKVLCSPRIELSGITGIMAVALFTGFTNKPKHAFLITLLTLFASNVVLEIMYLLHFFTYAGFYKWQLIEYSLMIVLTAIGMAFKRSRTAGIFISAFAGPTLFFIVSNFLTWFLSWQSMGYTYDMKGLMTCYTAGLPFYRNSVISTIVFLPTFIMAYHWMVKGKAVLVSEN